VQIAHVLKHDVSKRDLGHAHTGSVKDAIAQQVAGLSTPCAMR